MKTIVPAAEFAVRVLGKQKRKENTAYRLLSFCVQCQVDAGTLIYNAMTLELLLLSPEESSRLTALDGLVDRWFLVPEDEDDLSLADKLRHIAAHIQKPTERVSSYTIFTTTNCNARCYYCFEQGCTRRDMSVDTAERLTRYIAAHCGGKEVSLHWFGGEPLVNKEVIDIICTGLRAAGVKYRSAITSNGYLFDEKAVQKAKELWRLCRVQITLDGTEEVYNRTKAFVRAEGSPFKRVTDNIGLLLDAGLHVSIRLNVSEDNYKDLLILAAQLYERFGGRKGLYVYPSPLHGKSNDGTGWVKTSSETLIEKHGIVRDKLISLGLYSERRLARSMAATHCMADNDGAVAVLPDGALGCCEHFTESELFGHIDSETRNEAVLQSWKERTPKGAECGCCAYYPQCFMLKKCPGGRTCTKKEREEAEKKLRLRILNEYRIYTGKQTSEADDLPPENC